MTKLYCRTHKTHHVTRHCPKCMGLNYWCTAMFKMAPKDEDLNRLSREMADTVDRYVRGQITGISFPTPAPLHELRVTGAIITEPREGSAFIPFTPIRLTGE